MTKQMWNLIEELRNIPNVDFRTLSMMNLVNQKIIDSTNIAMSSVDTQYIEVEFKEDIDENFKKMFINQAKCYNILFQNYKCPFNQCSYYNLPCKKQVLQDHLEQHMGDKDHPIVISNTNPPYRPTVIKCYFMKKGKYYDLVPVIRRFVFKIKEDQERVTLYTQRNRVVFPEMSYLIEQMACLSNTDFQTLSLSNLINQSLKVKYQMNTELIPRVLKLVIYFILVINILNQ